VEAILKQKEREVLKKVRGKWGLHGKSNYNGIRATDFATNDNTIIRRYILATQNIQTGTLQSPATRTNKQIDRVLVNGRLASSVFMLEVVDVQTVNGITIHSS